MSEGLSEKAQESTEEPKDGKLVSTAEESEIVEKEVAKVRKVVVQAIREEFNGPIPHPDIMEKYERILPGSTDRIISMAEKQAAHRQAMEEIMFKSEARDGLLGVIFAFLLGIGCLVACVIVVCLVPKNAGAIASAFLGVTGIGSITTSFIRSTRQGKQKDNTPKSNKQDEKK